MYPLGLRSCPLSRNCFLFRKIDLAASFGTFSFNREIASALFDSLRMEGWHSFTESPFGITPTTRRRKLNDILPLSGPSFLPSFLCPFGSATRPNEYLPKLVPSPGLRFFPIRQRVEVYLTRPLGQAIRPSPGLARPRVYAGRSELRPRFSLLPPFLFFLLISRVDSCIIVRSLWSGQRRCISLPLSPGPAAVRERVPSHFSFLPTLGFCC